MRSHEMITGQGAIVTDRTPIAQAKRWPRG